MHHDIVGQMVVYRWRDSSRFKTDLRMKMSNLADCMDARIGSPGDLNVFKFRVKSPDCTFYFTLNSWAMRLTLPASVG